MHTVPTHVSAVDDDGHPIGEFCFDDELGLVVFLLSSCELDRPAAELTVQIGPLPDDGAAVLTIVVDGTDGSFQVDQVGDVPADVGVYVEAFVDAAVAGCRRLADRARLRAADPLDALWRQVDVDPELFATKVLRRNVAAALAGYPTVAAMLEAVDGTDDTPVEAFADQLASGLPGATAVFGDTVEAAAASLATRELP